MQSYSDCKPVCKACTAALVLPLPLYAAGTFKRKKQWINLQKPCLDARSSLQTTTAVSCSRSVPTSCPGMCLHAANRAAAAASGQKRICVCTEIKRRQQEGQGSRPTRTSTNSSSSNHHSEYSRVAEGSGAAGVSHHHHAGKPPGVCKCMLHISDQATSKAQLVCTAYLAALCTSSTTTACPLGCCFHGVHDAASICDFSY